MLTTELGLAEWTAATAVIAGGMALLAVLLRSSDQPALRSAAGGCAGGARPPAKGILADVDRAVRHVRPAFGDDCSSYRIPRSRRGHGQRRPRRRPRARGGRVFRLRVRPARRRARAAGGLRHAPRRRRAAAADAPRRGPDRARRARARADRDHRRRALRPALHGLPRPRRGALRVAARRADPRPIGAPGGSDERARRRRPREWHDDEVELLETIASQVARRSRTRSLYDRSRRARDRAGGAGPHLRGRLAVAVRVGDAGRDRRDRPRCRAREDLRARARRTGRTCTSHSATATPTAATTAWSSSPAARRPTRRARSAVPLVWKTRTIGALVLPAARPVHDGGADAARVGRPPGGRRRSSRAAA